MDSPEQQLMKDIALADQANELFDKLTFNSHQLRIETAPLARTILKEVINNYLDFANEFNIAPLFTEIALERAGEDGLHRV